jgi:hypothetical protein
MKTHIDGTIPEYAPEIVWVFGSNLAGHHGAGAALVALKKFGARIGVGRGLANNSYAIPTKDVNLKVLSLSEIDRYVRDFIRAVYLNPNKRFFITRIGCGLAGYEDRQIAPMFMKASKRNCDFPESWRKYL